MASLGQSLFVAAGDDGAYDDGTDLSVSGDASPPFCTAVGGTKLTVTNTGTATAPVLAFMAESAWGNAAEKDALHPKGGGGGGGISNYWPKPFYQYQNTANRTGPIGDGGSLTPAMRDLPDVALNADPATGYAIYIGADTPTPAPNNFLVIGGTSAAAPLWAAFTLLVNEGRALGGGAEPTGSLPSTPSHPVGFANPLLYSIYFGEYGNYGNDFHDISDKTTNLYYQALPGYDDATGLGSFNGASLLADMIAAGSSSTSGGGDRQRRHHRPFRHRHRQRDHAERRVCHHQCLLRRRPERHHHQRPQQRHLLAFTDAGPDLHRFRRRDRLHRPVPQRHHPHDRQYGPDP